MPVVTLTKSNVVALDNELYEQSAGTSYPSGETILVGTGSGSNTRTRMILKFDLGLIPNDAIINSATLKLTQTIAPGASRTLDIHRVTADWNGAVTWSSQPAYDPAKVVSFVSPASTGTQNIDVKSLVQSWVNGTPNYGLVVKDTDETTLNTRRSFGAFENTTAANQPQLVIDYTIPTTGKKQVEYVGSKTVSTGSTSTTFSGSIPSYQPGDLLLAFVGNGTNEDIDAPVGWTKISSDRFNGSSAIFSKVAVADEAIPQFSVRTATTWIITIAVFRNVKAVHQKSVQNRSGVSAFAPPAMNGTVDKLLVATLNFSTNMGSGSWVPPLSFVEDLDFAPGTPTSYSHQISHRYLHDKMSVTSSEMTSTANKSVYGASYGIMLEPKTNHEPTVTLSSPTDNQTLTEGSTYQISGSATDADSGNVVTVKFKIDDGTTYNVTASVSDGTTPLNFSKTLTYLNSRLYDGATPVTPILDDSVTHKLTVWAEDDKGGKSVDAVRNFTVLYNQPPQISGSDQDLGSISAPPSINYTVTDIEHYSFTITEKVGDTIIRSFAGTDGKQETLTIPDDIWITLQPDVTHNLTITATDQYGASSTRTYTFKRTVDGIELETRTPLPADAQPYRMVLTLNAQYPTNAVVNVQVCNNGYDDTPTWEDATSAVLNKRPYVFTNVSKTAENWGIKVKISILPGA